MDEPKNERFLARWSRRKAEARVGNELPDPSADPPAASAAVQEDVAEAPDLKVATDALERLPAAPTVSTNQDAEAAPLTLADVAKLTRESDFSRFVASGVDTDVKNAALKKLFSDPHFNLMDGLDVYIDDYNAPSPLPQHLLAKMAQAKFLGLVKEKADEALAKSLSFRAEGEQSRPANDEILRLAAQDDNRPPDVLAGDVVHAAPLETAGSDLPANSIALHEDADLQLQPDDDAGRSGAAAGAGEDAGRQH